MVYRSRTQIISDILRIADSGTGKTRIMYNAFLSYALVTKYINFLIDNGMLMYDEKTHLYRILEKGKRFLRMYDEINKLLDSKINKTLQRYAK